MRETGSHRFEPHILRTRTHGKNVQMMEKELAQRSRRKQDESVGDVLELQSESRPWEMKSRKPPTLCEKN